MMASLTIALALTALALLFHNIRTMRGLKRSAGALLNELTDGIVILSEQPDRAYCNPAACTMLSLQPESDMPPHFHRLEASGLLAEICASATAPRGVTLPPLELVDGKGQFRSWRQTPINATIGGVRVRGVVLQDRTEIHTLSHLLEESRRRDPLTGLATPELLHEYTGRALEAAGRSRVTVAMLVLEIDQFEEIFDARGWAAASELLLQAALAVSTEVRAMDLMARVGQNRFAVALTALEEPSALPRIAGRFLDAMRFTYAGTAGQPVTITASVGIARAGTDGATSLRLLETATQACRRAREEGGDRARFYEIANDEQPPVDIALVAELRQGLDKGRFLMRYQPIVALRTRRLTGYEALIRWRHPTRGEVAPGEFVTTAERAGLIHALGDFALAHACRDAARWPSDLVISINMSVVELTAGDAPARILAALKATDLPPSRVRIEITETARISDLGRLRSAADEIRALGVAIALDDFGTGHSSLTHLQAMSFDCLKIDGRFVRDLESPRTATMIRMLITYARQIGVAVVAEGVETEAQAAQLLAMGCSHAQGWLFGRPMLAEDLPRLAAVG